MTSKLKKKRWYDADGVLVILEKKGRLTLFPAYTCDIFPRMLYMWSVRVLTKVRSQGKRHCIRWEVQFLIRLRMGILFCAKGKYSCIFLWFCIDMNSAFGVWSGEEGKACCCSETSNLLIRVINLCM